MKEGRFSIVLCLVSCISLRGQKGERGIAVVISSPKTAETNFQCQPLTSASDSAKPLR